MSVNEPTRLLSRIVGGSSIRAFSTLLAAAISASCATTVAPAAARLSEYHFVTDASRRLAGNVKGGLAYPGGVALPPDRLHRVIVAGAVDPTDRSSGLMFRLGPYGRFDRTFGRKGFARYHVRARVRGKHTRDVSAAGIAQSRDRILVTGDKDNPYGAYRRSITAFTMNGRVDRSFGVRGSLTRIATPLGTIANKALYTPTFLDDRRMLFPAPCGENLCVVRVGWNGVADPTFAAIGYIAPPPGYWLRHLMVGPGCIYVLYEVSDRPDGSLPQGQRPRSRIAVRRFTTDGMLDPSFGTEGETILPIPPESELAGLDDPFDGPATRDGAYVTSAVVDRASRLVIALREVDTGFASIYRLGAAGGLDSTFGPSGRRWVGWRWGDGFVEITTDRRSRILVSGGYDDYHESLEGPNHYVPMFARLNEDGSRDRTWPHHPNELRKRYGDFTPHGAVIRGRWLYFTGDQEGNPNSFHVIRMRYPR